MATDPKDIGELQKALNDASGKASALWITFVTFGLYLAIAFGSVTHRNLFLEDPIKLPILNAELPLVGFFVVAPTVLVIFHFYVFLQLIALAKKGNDYNALLNKKVPDEIDSQYLRQRLDSFLILQLLVGPSSQRGGNIGVWLRIIAWITLVGAPILILLQGQVTFLPYHQEGVLWTQRICILVDLLVIWFFWNAVRGDNEPTFKKIPIEAWWTVGGVATVCVVFFAIRLATFPGELVERAFPVAPFRELLFAGQIDEVSGRPLSLFSNRLVLTDQSFVDSEKVEKLGISRSFRGRDLSGIVLNRADLRKADFTGAMLNGAKINSTKLQNARFGCETTGKEKENVGWPADGCTWLQDVWLIEAQLQGADLSGARLQGANLRGVQAHGADFSGAQLDGAIFVGARLHGANFGDATLQGADFDGAEVEGVDFHQARLQGSSFRRARLQGANMPNAKLSAATLAGAKVWRVRGGIDFSDIDLAGVDAEQKPWEEETPQLSFDVWVRRSKIEAVLTEEARDLAMRRLSVLDPKERDPSHSIGAAIWKDRANQTPGNDRKRVLAALLADLICNSNDAPYVMRGLIKNGRIKDADPSTITKRLQDGRLNQSACRGVKKFHEGDWAMLGSLASQ